jgi:hypothetical protein
MRDVLARGHRTRDLDAAVRFGRELRRNNRIDALRDRRARHDAYRTVRGHGAAEGLRRQHLAFDRKRDRVVFGSARRVVPAQSVAVHGGAVEAWDIDRGDDVGGEHAAGCRIDRHRFARQAIGMAIDPLEHRGHLAALAESLHANVRSDRHSLSWCESKQVASTWLTL